MRTRNKLAAGFVVVLGLFALVFLRPYEGSWLIVTKDHVYDFVGPIRAGYTRLTRDCSSVSNLSPASAMWQPIRARLGEYGSHSPATPRQILQVGNWYLSHSEFEMSEPGVVLLEQTSLGLQPRAEWSGSAAPFKDEPAMWEYLGKNAPQAPTSLIECFEISASNAGT